MVSIAQGEPFVNTQRTERYPSGCFLLDWASEVR
jgi:hypothetical protein